MEKGSFAGLTYPSHHHPRAHQGNPELIQAGADEEGEEVGAQLPVCFPSGLPVEGLEQVRHPLFPARFVSNLEQEGLREETPTR